LTTIYLFNAIMKDIVVSCWSTAASKTQCFYGKLFAILDLHRSDIQIGNKNYKNLSKRNFALSKIDNFYEYFLPIFVIFIEQIIVRRLKIQAHIQVIGLICLSFVQ